MNSLQLVILQERMQVTGFLNKMPVRDTHFNTTEGKYTEVARELEVELDDKMMRPKLIRTLISTKKE